MPRRKPVRQRLRVQLPGPRSARFASSRWLCVDAASSMRRPRRVRPHERENVGIGRCVQDSTASWCRPETACSNACPIAVTQESAAGVQQQIEMANAKWCGEFQKRGCPAVPRDCAAHRAPGARPALLLADWDSLYWSRPPPRCRLFVRVFRSGRARHDRFFAAVDLPRGTCGR
jgi:hypothetical protein